MRKRYLVMASAVIFYSMSDIIFEAIGGIINERKVKKFLKDNPPNNAEDFREINVDNGCPEKPFDTSDEDAFSEVSENISESDDDIKEEEIPEEPQIHEGEIETGDDGEQQEEEEKEEIQPEEVHEELPEEKNTTDETVVDESHEVVKELEDVIQDTSHEEESATEEFHQKESEDDLVDEDLFRLLITRYVNPLLEKVGDKHEERLIRMVDYLSRKNTDQNVVMEYSAKLKGLNKNKQSPDKINRKLNEILSNFFSCFPTEEHDEEF